MKKSKSKVNEGVTQIKGGVIFKPLSLFDESTGICKKCNIPYCKHWIPEVMQIIGE